MRVMVDQVGAGLHPSEVVVAVKTSDGTARLTVDRRALKQGDFLEIGDPIGKEGNRFLVELPRETSSGAWRVWVTEDALEVA